MMEHGVVRSLLSAIPLCVALVTPSVAQESVPTPDSLFAAVSSAQSSVRSLAGIMTREIKNWDDSTARFSGRFYWQSPKYRLNFAEPEEMRVVYDGRRLMTERPAEREVTVKEVGEQASEQGFGSPWEQVAEQLSNSYRFKVVGKDPSAKRSVWVLDGAAKDTSSLVKRVMLWLDRDRHIPWRIETYGAGKNPTTIYLVDSLVQRGNVWLPVKFRNWYGIQGRTLSVTTTLSAVRANESLPASLFAVKLPGDSAR